MVKSAMKFLAVIALFLLIASGCSKGGCTDKTALNYDPHAKWSDHSCKYYIDAYLGTYKGIDSAGYEINDSFLNTSVRNGFIVDAFGTNSVTFYDFPLSLHGIKIDTNPQNFIDTNDARPATILGLIYLRAIRFIITCQY